MLLSCHESDDMIMKLSGIKCNFHVKLTAVIWSRG